MLWVVLSLWFLEKTCCCHWCQFCSVCLPAKVVVEVQDLLNLPIVESRRRAHLCENVFYLNLSSLVILGHEVPTNFKKKKKKAKVKHPHTRVGGWKWNHCNYCIEKQKGNKEVTLFTSGTVYMFFLIRLKTPDKLCCSIMTMTQKNLIKKLGATIVPCTHCTLQLFFRSCFK